MPPKRNKRSILGNRKVNRRNKGGVVPDDAVGDIYKKISSQPLPPSMSPKEQEIHRDRQLAQIIQADEAKKKPYGNIDYYHPESKQIETKEPIQHDDSLTRERAQRIQEEQFRKVAEKKLMQERAMRKKEREDLESKYQREELLRKNAEARLRGIYVPMDTLLDRLHRRYAILIPPYYSYSDRQRLGDLLRELIEKSLYLGHSEDTIARNVNHLLAKIRLRMDVDDILRTEITKKKTTQKTTKRAKSPSKRKVTKKKKSIQKTTQKTTKRAKSPSKRKVTTKRAKSPSKRKVTARKTTRKSSNKSSNKSSRKSSSKSTKK